jgi:hypothetical protein
MPLEVWLVVAVALLVLATAGTPVLIAVLDHRKSPIIAFLDRHIRAGYVVLAVMWALLAVGSHDRPARLALALLGSILAVALAFLLTGAPRRGR